MPVIDFQSALALLLRDGGWRDAFRADAAGTCRRLGVEAADADVLAGLEPSQLEVQAEILLRKRLERIRPHLKESCRRLGPRLWAEFRRYGREHWENEGLADAVAFAGHLSVARPASLARWEWMRLRFIAGPNRRFAVYPISSSASLFRWRVGVVVLRRRSDGTVAEGSLGLGL